MALGYLFILSVILFILLVLSIILLWFVKGEKASQIIILITTGFSLILTYLNVTSLPSNYVFLRGIGYLFGICALVGSVLFYRHHPIAGKVLIAFSMVASFVQVFYG